MQKEVFTKLKMTIERNKGAKGLFKETMKEIVPKCEERHEYSNISISEQKANKKESRTKQSKQTKKSGQD